jgi:AraC-like DNA-binding protein
MRLADDPLLGDDLLHLRVLEAANITIDRGWNTRDVCSSYWRFYANDADGAWLELPVGSHRLDAGHAHLVPAWVNFSCRNHRPLGHLYVHFELVGLPGSVVRAVFPRPLAVRLEAADRDSCHALGHRLRERPVASPALLCRIKAVVYAGLAPAFAALAVADVSRCRHLIEGTNPMTPALRLIEDHLPEPLPNRRLARSCGLAEDHFIRQFRRHLGQTPAHYVQERRIAAAAARLRFSSDSIEAIATTYGFSNRHHFSRVFARRMGIGPAGYRARRTP